MSFSLTLGTPQHELMQRARRFADQPLTGIVTRTPVLSRVAERVPGAFWRGESR